MFEVLLVGGALLLLVLLATAVYWIESHSANPQASKSRLFAALSPRRTPR
jgi:hypothetical protein